MNPSKTVSAGFVQVQALVQELAQETSALGDPEGIDSFDSAPRLISGFGTVGPQVRSNVPGRQQPKPGHRSPGGGVDHLVHLARLEPRRQIDVGGVRNAPAVFEAREKPLPARYDLFRSVLVLLDGQHRLPVLQVVGGVSPVHSVGQVLHLGGTIGLEGYDDLA